MSAQRSGAAAIFTALLLLACGEPIPDVPHEHSRYDAHPLIADLQSNYGKEEVVVEVFGKDSSEVDALATEIRNNTTLAELDSGAAVPLQATETVTPAGLTLLHFKPQSWNRAKWHKFKIKEPAVGRINGGPQVGGFFVARFIYDSYLTVGHISVGGQYDKVFGNLFIVGMSEKTPRPSSEDVAVYQNGAQLTCGLIDDVNGSVVNLPPPSWSWAFTCERLDWREQVELRFSSTFAGVPLRDLQGNPGWSITFALPPDYVNQAKWSYMFPEFGAGL